MELVRDMRPSWFGVALLVLLAGLLLAHPVQAQGRSDALVEGGWRSIFYETGPEGGRAEQADIAFQSAGFDDAAWQLVEVPHNWQGYAYARQVRNGSLHGSALYRKTLTIEPPGRDERIALWFEGVSAYATIWLNGTLVGRHAGGLVGFEVDITDAVRPGANLLAVRADMPKGITDLPWAPGDDQLENGFSEGSQPLGIFRPVHLVRTSKLHVRPFGIYAWGGLGDINAASARLTARSELTNASEQARRFTMLVQMIAPDGTVAAQAKAAHRLDAGASGRIEMQLPPIARPQLWSPDTPTLYILRATVMEGRRIVDRQDTPFGIRTTEIRSDAAGHRRLYVNGSPIFLRGTAEYEHLLGTSHAFTAQQVDARIAQVKAAGFNAFRDAHTPHNLRYGTRIAEDGLMWWPQFSAHNWFDNPDYRANFKRLLAQWVRERRNNPANFLWGLQNESRLPAEFAQEAVAIIRDLDPTASIQRLIVTCNGGEGADWNVPQNWSGTYGGDPDLYAQELAQQGLVGEYGAWRSLGLHGDADGDQWTEERMAALEQKKARLGDSVSDSAVGHFQWLLTTHENPGRPMRGDGTQIFDGIRPLDHVGPANNKGLMTLWGEPLDVFYMYRARQVPGRVQPFAYIVSHTWPDRFAGPGVQSGLEVYSNCDAVDLFNDAAGDVPLGRRTPDTHQRFVWDAVPVRFDVLMARCLMDGRVVHQDLITLNNLPPAPAVVQQAATPPLVEGDGANDLYRVNVGGKGFVDAEGHRWQADRHLDEGADWGWTSWADRWAEIEPALGSRRLTHDPIGATHDQQLFQSFRYGREQLRYRFRVPDGEYRITLYFVEPWYGRAAIDARGWRVFDVAVNGEIVLSDLDIFAEAGFGRAMRKTVTAKARSGWLEIGFPHVAAGQAILSGIRISGDGPGHLPRETGTDLIAAVIGGTASPYLDNGDSVYAVGDGRWTRLPSDLLDRDFVQPGRASGAEMRLTLRVRSVLYLALAAGDPAPPGWAPTELTGAIKRNAGTGGNGSGRGRPEPVRFVSRMADAGETVTAPAGLPVIVKRFLPSPFAPGNFTFAKDKGMHQAESEDARRTHARVASVVQGYGGQGYAAFDAGQGSIAWPVETGIAGSHGFRLRYQLPPGVAGRTVTLVLTDRSGIDVATVVMTLQPGEGWREVEGATASAINAGSYTLRIDVADGEGLLVDSLAMD